MATIQYNRSITVQLIAVPLASEKDEDHPSATPLSLGWWPKW